MELLLPVLRADFTVCETYRYAVEPPLACPIAVFGGSTDPHVPVHHLDTWKEMTEGEFFRYLLPGGHFFIQENTGFFFRILGKTLQHLILSRTLNS
jgi:medium-chain acyl-[acyl-carrier-protein] hydrolase